MTTDQSIELIKFFGIVGAAITAYITTMVNVRAYLEKRLSELKAGATEIMVLHANDKRLEADLLDKWQKLNDHLKTLKDEYEKRDDKRGEQIRDLAKDINEFTLQALKIFNVQK